ncbi:hypothetical protein GGS24DRAFT_286655 [Hypoxylon argillaceum]|nr:hypothetical protein GGS24DRAFT_286655 [Hypoxylon argillaceum]
MLLPLECASFFRTKGTLITQLCCLVLSTYSVELGIILSQLSVSNRDLFASAVLPWRIMSCSFPQNHLIGLKYTLNVKM